MNCTEYRVKGYHLAVRSMRSCRITVNWNEMTEIKILRLLNTKLPYTYFAESVKPAICRASMLRYYSSCN